MRRHVVAAALSAAALALGVDRVDIVGDLTTPTATVNGVSRPVDAANIATFGSFATDVTPPSQPQFEVCPVVSGLTILMTSTVSTDETSSVEYQFREILGNPGGGHLSPWQVSRTWTDVGLVAATDYRYVIRARDQAQNQTADSDPGCASTAAGSSDTTPPSPPPQFVFGPGLSDPTTAGMVWNSSADATPPVLYEIDEMTGNPGGTDASALTLPSYFDGGLQPGLTYCYRARAYDSAVPANFTAWSDSGCVITPPAADTSPPTPNPPIWSTPPTAIGTTAIAMEIGLCSDSSPPVQYSFEETSHHQGGSSSGWQLARQFLDGDLQPGTLYTYRVQARDAIGNTTGFSEVRSATTFEAPPFAGPHDPVRDWSFTVCWPDRSDRPDSAAMRIFDPSGALSVEYPLDSLGVFENCYRRGYVADSTKVGQWLAEETLYWDNQADSMKTFESFTLDWTYLYPPMRDSTNAIYSRSISSQVTANFDTTKTILRRVDQTTLDTQSTVIADFVVDAAQDTLLLAITDSLAAGRADLAGIPGDVWRTTIPVSGQITGDASQRLQQLPTLIDAVHQNVWDNVIDGTYATNSAEGKMFELTKGPTYINIRNAIANDGNLISTFAHQYMDSLAVVHGPGVYDAFTDIAELADSIAAHLGTIDIDADAIVDSVLSGIVDEHGMGDYTGGAELGGGQFVHVIDVRHVPGLSVIPNARVTILSLNFLTRYVDALTNSFGIVTCHLDAGTYWAVVSQPALHDSEAGIFTVTGSGGVTEVDLTGLAIPAPGDPLSCSLAIDTMDLFAVSVDSIEVSVTFDGLRGMAGGALISPSAVRDTTGTNGTGRAVVPLIRSSEITSADGRKTYTFRFLDIARSRRTHPLAFATINRVTVPDSTTASLRYNLP